MFKYTTAALLAGCTIATETESKADAQRELVYHTNSVGIKTPDWPYFGMPFAHPWAPWGGFYGAHPMHYGMGMYHPYGMMGMYHPWGHMGMMGMYHPYGMMGMYHPWGRMGMWPHFGMWAQNQDPKAAAAEPKKFAQVDSEPMEEDEENLAQTENPEEYDDSVEVQSDEE